MANDAPLFVSLMVFVWLVPTSTMPKSVRTGRNAIGGTTVPVSFTSCGVEVALSLIVITPFALPMIEETNPASMVQVSAGCNVEHLLDAENPPLAAIELTTKSAVPVFVSLIAWVPLRLPAERVPKLRVLADNETCCALTFNPIAHVNPKQRANRDDFEVIASLPLVVKRNLRRSVRGIVLILSNDGQFAWTSGQSSLTLPTDRAAGGRIRGTGQTGRSLVSALRIGKENR